MLTLLFTSAATTNATLDVVWNYDTIMDRFQGRLMLPIWDAKGKNVLGFGGRILPDPSNSSSFGPKYLNSPESAVFEKSRILFGQHAVENANSNNPLVFVEGYMDAIALWSVGVKTAVASMGTAISMHQLELAATTSNRIVICLDNDAAGTTAVERICRNGFLLQLVHDNPVVRVAVAQLPDGTKDPADFVDESSSPAKDFWEQVVDPAKDWMDWYIRRLVGGHNASAERSFADVFESVAEFMAEAMTPQDRTNCAPRVAGLLEKLLSNEKKNDATLRVQLESDLLDLSSRVASARETVEHSGTSVLGALSQGYGNWDDSSSLLSSNATRENSDGVTFPTDGRVDYLDAEWGEKTSNVREEQEPGRPRRFMEKKEPKALTPHFSGFDFVHQTDQEWLGLSKKKVRELAVLYTLSTLMFSYHEYW
jgi:DNA primase